METWIIYVLMAVGVILIFLIAKELLRLARIPPHQRVAVYSLGRLRRISGPGLVFWLQGLDQPIVYIDIGEKPIFIEIPGVFVNGQFLTVTFNLWCAFDPQEVLANNLNRIHTLLQLDERTRLTQIRILLKDALAEELRNHIQRHPLPPTPQLNDQLEPILFGTDQRRELLQELRPVLDNAIRSIGYRLSNEHPITISNFAFDRGYAEGLGRGRIVELWRRQLPDLSDSELAQYIASYDRIDVGNVRRLIVNSSEEVEVEQRTRTGSQEERIRTQATPIRPQATTPPAQPQAAESMDPSVPRGPASNEESAQTVVSANNYRLSKTDLEILQRPPVYSP